MPRAAQQHTPPKPRRDRRPGDHNAHYKTARWQKLRTLVLTANPLCQSQGCRRPATDVDHVVALAKGGTDDLDNLRAYCTSCHSKKTAAHDGSFGRGPREA
jgi:5-methylcytosine-specific restriction protein A